ncbi:PUA-like domain-containing protein [Mucidula mucida]|nr:PUA-like domain-containing protein [Mucidula mucida]
MEARRKSLMENAALYDPSVFENRRPTVDVYGAVKTARVGQVWEHRTGASAAGVHRQSQAGISPGPYGAYSICLSGRYNDEDRGDRIVYTGTGGQADDFGNPTGHPTEDQSEDHPMNKSLIMSTKTGKPVRVLRGPDPRSEYAPKMGYRYDGLYTVRNWWTDASKPHPVTKRSFALLKFELERVSGQPPLARRTV